MGQFAARKFALLSALPRLMLIGAAGLALASSPAATHTVPAAVRAALPQTVFWAWDEPEDMRPLADRRAGVAYLAATILLDDSLHLTPRMQPLLVATETPLISVVRVETRRGFRDTSRLRDALTGAVLDAANHPAIHAVQIDFDATRSERVFYIAVLNEVRGALPRDTSLSITALLSWCAHDDWIHSLPIDEAVPMYFRLGREAHNVLNGDSAYSIREPLCANSAGIATDEPAHNLLLASKRVYIFNPRPWNAHQLQLLTRSERP